MKMKSMRCNIFWMILGFVIIIIAATWPRNKEKYANDDSMILDQKEEVKEISREYVPAERVTITGSSKAGFPIKTPSIDSCRTACDNDPSCVAYSYDGYIEECDVKTNTQTLMLNDNRYRTTFFKQPHQFENTSYHGWKNMAGQGKDIAVQSNVTRLSDCDLLCKHPNNIRSCVGFVYDQRENICRIKANVTEMNPAKGFDTFVKIT